MERSFFLPPADEVAPRLLGSRLTVQSAEGPVAIRITEVEAYHGVGVPGPYDPGSHSRDRMTSRNASMFGPPGHAYVYLSYGIHFAINLVCSPEGAASGVLLRAGEVVSGLDLAHHRRGRRDGARSVPFNQLARGPGNLGQALGVTRAIHDGLDVFAEPFDLQLAENALEHISSGPRVGVSGVAGGTGYPWRFWVAGDRTVSAYRPGRNVNH
ncbi:MAG: DNA-3-methyladenine glycosylase, partial [Microbacteriaceae bacterium]|nr:DNA-3-methyladenine glycosylase [Microbacteriaceae bacterium]